MVKFLIVYYSRTGNTEKMAKSVFTGADEAGAEVTMKRVQDSTVDDLQAADVIVFGTPTSYGHSASDLRKFIDKSVVLHGKLVGKVGGAFSSSHNIGGGNETAIGDLLDAMLIHGMVLQGAVDGDHYGPVSIGLPDTRVETQCRNLGERLTRLAEKLQA